MVFEAVADVARIDSLAHDANDITLAFKESEIHAPNLAPLGCGTLVEILD